VGVSVPSLTLLWVCRSIGPRGMGSIVGGAGVRELQRDRSSTSLNGEPIG